MTVTQKIEKIRIEELCLWTENPRDPVDIDLTDYDIIRRAIKDYLVISLYFLRVKTS